MKTDLFKYNEKSNIPSTSGHAEKAS